MRLFLSAAEASGDLIAARLLAAVRERVGEVDCRGIAGPRMQAAGCLPLADLTSRSAMLLGLASEIVRGLRLLAEIDRFLGRWKPHAVVLVDSPFLHLPLARRAKVHGLRVFYYVAPQVWAWAPWRVGKIRRRVDQVACILPFEAAWLEQYGICAEFVGHPLFEALAERKIDQTWVDGVRQEHTPVVALFPGSRRHVVREVLPGQLEVAAQVHRRFRRAGFLVSCARAELEGEIRRLSAETPVPLRVVSGRNQDVLEAADLVLVASGTTTLEVAYHRRPMIVMYNHSRLAYHLLGRWLIRTPYLSLPNILAGREIVPEFMPYYRSTRPIAECAIEILSTPHRQRRIAEDARTVVEPLVGLRASENAARLLASCLERWHGIRPSGVGGTCAARRDVQ